MDFSKNYSAISEKQAPVYATQKLGLEVIEEWKTTDEANPNLFNYITRLNKCELKDAKIQSRQLTEQELKELEEAAAAKNKKNVKKDTKGVIEPAGPTPEELEKMAQIQKEKDLEEQRLKEQWEQLDEQTKFYRTYEDKFKHPSIQYENYNNVTVEIEEKDLVIFEERVLDDGGDWLYLIKIPNLTEEELAKMRKSKPKSLNLNDLNPVVMRTWINYEEIAKEQTFPGIDASNEANIPPDIPRPKLDDTYIYLKVSVENPYLAPELQTLSMNDLIPKPKPIIKDPPEIESVKEFRKDLEIIFESLAIEFSSQFGKDLNISSEQMLKSSNLSIQKKTDLHKRKERKEAFLYDFNMSGKYKILKDRIKKNIVVLCQDKFKKTGSITGTSTSDTHDQFYSEIYEFLMNQMNLVLNEIIFQKKEELHDNIITGYEQTLQERDKFIREYTSENRFEGISKLALEYEILLEDSLSDRNYKKLQEIEERDYKVWKASADFCLRYKKFSKAGEYLLEALKFNPLSHDLLTLMVCIQAKKMKQKETMTILKQLLKEDKYNLLYNSLMSFICNFNFNEKVN